MTGHGCYFDEDDMGFYMARCACGWLSPPVPDKEDAADAYGDHRASTAIAEWEASR